MKPPLLRTVKTEQTIKPLSVLVVEDDTIAQQVIQQLLATGGAIVDTADNGSQALQKIQTKDYALVVTDLGLPDQDGCALAHAIHCWQRQQCRKISVIVALSAQMDAKNRQRCLEAGMHAAFTKPLYMQIVPALLALAVCHPERSEGSSQWAQDPSLRSG